MDPTPSNCLRFIGVLAALVCASAQGDVVETKNGARLVGKVIAIDGSSVEMTTDFAGAIKVKQSEVVRVITDEPLNVRLSSGTVLQGKLGASADGGLEIAGPDGTLSTRLERVAATWAPGATDPAIVALQRTWTYEVAVDITGKSGNKDQLGTAVSGRAVLKTPQDTLQFYTLYDRQVVDGEKSADQLKIGVDYQNNFAGRKSWYVRDEGGFDRVKDINLYNIAAAGFGYDLIKEEKHTLTIRAGLSYRYEGYRSPAAEDVSSAGLDLGLAHVWDHTTWSLSNRLSVVPTFDDLGNYRALHESYFEFPMADPDWRLRLGLSNDYNSEPAPGLDRLDTTYFARLVLNWK